ncbi:MAG TPA: hypothetical protein VMV29_13680 [Ktedonobacterales bacterium]|nr:hypothetical protein [Ktedonobacterales bacterium]
MIEFQIGQNRTCVRFGRLTQPQFQATLTEFKRAFPDALWSKQESGWLISSRTLTEVLRFAYATFPAEHVVVTTVATPPHMLFA